MLEICGDIDMGCRELLEIYFVRCFRLILEGKGIDGILVFGWWVIGCRLRLGVRGCIDWDMLFEIIFGNSGGLNLLLGMGWKVDRVDGFIVDRGFSGCIWLLEYGGIVEKFGWIME